MNFLADKDVFFTCTHGGSSVWKSIEECVKDKKANIISRFACIGYDTFGPFKLVGGIAKGHPNEKDCTKAVDYFKDLESKR